MMNKDITVKGTNPITKLDFPDPDVICVEDTFYMISTTMHFMPGAEILRSYDLINWEHASFIYERLDSTPAQRLENDLHIYGKGMWAATIRYHEGMFYVVFVCNDTGKTYLYRSAEIEGPWVKSQIEGFYHDSSLLFDNGSAYLVYGNTDIYLTELNDDLTAPKEGGLHRLIVSDKGNPQLGLEGSHLYKIEGRYYLFMIHSKRDRWRRVEACYSSDSLLGEFAGGDIFDDDLSYRNMGIAQGGIVEGPKGVWNSVMFQDSGAVGRLPILVPVSWSDKIIKDSETAAGHTDKNTDSDESIQTVKYPVFGCDGKASHDLYRQSFSPDYKYSPLTDSDDFKYDPKEMYDKDRKNYGCFGFRSIWQFNHEPDLSLVRCDAEAGNLYIKTDKLSKNIYHAKNILTQRMTFPGCVGEVTVDGSGLNDGDTAGLAAFQGNYAWVGLRKEEGKLYAVMSSFTNNSGDVWNLSDESGMIEEKIELAESVVRIRLKAVFSGEDGTEDTAFCEIDRGNGFEKIGQPHKLSFRLDHFTGCRFGLFIYSEEKTGGEAGFTNFVYAPSSQL